jgi:hypothetical protein
MDKMYLGFVKADQNAVQAFMGMLIVAIILAALVFATPCMIAHAPMDSGTRTAVSMLMNIMTVLYCWIFSLAYKDWKFYTS